MVLHHRLGVSSVCSSLCSLFPPSLPHALSPSPRPHALLCVCADGHCAVVRGRNMFIFGGSDDVTVFNDMHMYNFGMYHVLSLFYLSGRAIASMR